MSNESTGLCAGRTTIRLRSGKYFDLVDPQPDQFTIEDIAGALSKVCRYGGQIDRFYCPTPDQRVLTSDLEWVPAGDLEPGTELLSFDEHAHQAGRFGTRRRRYRPGVVIHNIPVRREVWALEMEDGSVVKSSLEHPWLIATKTSRCQVWKTTKEIIQSVRSGSKRYMHKFFHPWKAVTSRDGGWLAGVYDGEGSFSFGNRRGVTLSFAQKPGLVLDKMLALTTELGFGDFYTKTSTKSGVTNVQSRGGWRENARFLGMVRPHRLLAKFKEGLGSGVFNKQLEGGAHPLRVVRCYSEGVQWVSGIETSTRTYFCEGFGAHNSVAEHSVRCCGQAALDGCTPEVQRVVLMHDAAEAFVGDMTRPLKNLIPEYRKIEVRVEFAVFSKYGLLANPEDWAVVKEIDDAMLFAEKRVLFSADDVVWQDEEKGRKLHLHPESMGWSPHAAERTFLTLASHLKIKD